MDKHQQEDASDSEMVISVNATWYPYERYRRYSVYGMPSIVSTTVMLGVCYLCFIVLWCTLFIRVCSTISVNAMTSILCSITLLGISYSAPNPYYLCTYGCTVSTDLRHVRMCDNEVSVAYALYLTTVCSSVV